MVFNDITVTAIGLVNYLKSKNFQSYIIGKVANLILLKKTQKDMPINITGTILTTATDSELSRMFKQYTNNGRAILHFGKYDFLIITTDNVNKYRKHQPIIMDTLMYDGEDFIDYKNAKQFTLDGVISLNDTFSPYVFNYILNQKALYNYKIDVNTISQMSLNADFFVNVAPAHFLNDKPYGVDVIQFLVDYELCTCNKYIKQYNRLKDKADVVKKLLAPPYNFNAVEIYYLILHTHKGLNKKQTQQYVWITDNYSMLDKTEAEFRVALINTIFDNDYILEQGMPLLRELVCTLYRIRRLKKDVAVREKDVIYNMCCRPLFPRQLHITDEQLLDIYGKNDLELKKKILLHLATLPDYPTEGLYKYLITKPF